MLPKCTNILYCTPLKLKDNMFTWQKYDEIECDNPCATKVKSWIHQVENKHLAIWKMLNKFSHPKQLSIIIINICICTLKFRLFWRNMKVAWIKRNLKVTWIKRNIKVAWIKRSSQAYARPKYDSSRFGSMYTDMYCWQVVLHCYQCITTQPMWQSYCTR